MNVIVDVAEGLIELILVSPLLLLYRKRNRKSNFLLGVFCAFYLVHDFLLHLPRYDPAFNLIGGQWNWSGKLYAVLGSIGFYWLCRKHFRRYDFITIGQKEGSVKANVLAIGVILLITVIGFSFNRKVAFSTEALLFQLTMPGIDEELAFRGIMLGVLSMALVGQIQMGRWNFGAPSIWITALLFGLVHGFWISREWQFHVSWGAIFYPFLLGWLMGWMTIKSKSILMATVLHNATNFVGTLLTMLT